jgi:uncharacterized protein (TIGR02588 family)
MKRPAKNWLEWTIFWVSGALILGVAAFLAYLALAMDRRDPSLVVTLGSPERVPSGYAVPVTIANEGDVTAEQVAVEVWFEDAAAERGQLTIAFVPGGSRRHGWVGFTREPARERLRVRLIGYEKP